MAYADRRDFGDPRSARHARHLSPFPQSHHDNHEHPRYADMKRDRSSQGEGRRDRGSLDRAPRGQPNHSHDRARSTSPTSRRPDGFRDRDYARDDRSDRREKDIDYDRTHDREPRGRDGAPKGPRHRSHSVSPLGKRRRSSSPAPAGNRNKKSRRDRGERRRAKKTGNPRNRRSPSPYQDRHQYPAEPQSDRPDLFDHPTRLRSRSPPPLRESNFDRGPPPTGPSRKKSKRRDRDEARLAKRSQPFSDANSIEVGMNRRGPLASGSSYHGSPVPQSPRGGGRAGWSGQHQYSPQSQHNSGAPTGSQAFGHSPPHPPTGPMNPGGRGFSRGGFRGGGRGGHFKQLGGPPTGPAADRGHANLSGDNSPYHGSPRYSVSNHSDMLPPAKDDGDRDDARDDNRDDCRDDVPLADSKVPEVESAHEEMKDNDDQTSPPTRAPPTGPSAATPSGPKFSFAFKATSKAPVAAPKPEISQKFSAAPPRREPQPADDRSHRDRDLPRDTPTAPASSRARSDHNIQRPPEPPRTRIVRRIEKRLKPKPRLPEHLVTSESPFYRKPGNESVVGSGTYGKVFKGMQIYSGRLVALKRIRMEGERDGFPVTAVREIKLLQSLKHDNIVALQEVMVEKNDCFMVFEYLSHDLTGLLNHPSFKLDPAQRKHLAKQLFDGLDYLHTRGVLHRDIKAANILVSSDGILKLADFGLARFYAKHHQNDYTNRVITIWYRSPELLLGETQYGAAVDVWSAACVMVEIFTRHAIFAGDGTEINQLDKIYAILGTPNKVEWPDLVKMEWFELLRPGYRRPNVFAEKYKDRVPAAAFDLLASMFQYDPAKRPSAHEVLNHPYFTTEQPPPRQATELAAIEGDWHEFESKALRREKEKQERDARRAATAKDKDGERKRASSSHGDPDAKRPHVEGRPSSSSERPAGTTK